jgi:acetyl-CoA carboxylase carboxyltransferase component
MRKLQLEYGAEIGRPVVNFKGPVVFCVISRYHGGAYVVFSRTLNDQLQVPALEGTSASVIGGAPAAAVVFSGEVEARARKDPRLKALTERPFISARTSSHHSGWSPLQVGDTNGQIFHGWLAAPSPDPPTLLAHECSLNY